MAARTRFKAQRKGVYGASEQRTRQTWIGGSPYGNWTNLGTAGTYFPNFTECRDSTNSPPYPETNFYLEDVNLQVGTLSGVNQGPKPSETQFRFSGQPVGPFSYGDSETGHLSLSAREPEDYINKALATANPNRADTDVFLALFELRELVPLIRDIGLKFKDNKKKGVGSNPIVKFGSVPIEVKFGWGPLIGDLLSVLAIAEKIDKRITSVRKLQNKVQRVKTKLDHRTASWSSFQRNVGNLLYTYHRKTTFDAWMVKKHTIVGTPLTPPPKLTNMQAFYLAYTEEGLITLWNALPWSWLVDYFFNVSEFLAANSNRISGYKVLSLNIMCKTSTRMWHETNRYATNWSGTLKLKPLEGERRSLRRLSLINPSAQIPPLTILTSSQLGTLGTLAIAKLTGGSTLVGKTL